MKKDQLRGLNASDLKTWHSPVALNYGILAIEIENKLWAIAPAN